MSHFKRVAVVSGSNKGIGFGIVKLLLQKGFDGDVILCSRDETRGRDAVQRLNELGLKPLFHQLDIEDDASIDRIKQYLIDNYNGINVLVNNAAIAYTNDSMVPFEEQMENTFKTNFYSTRNLCLKLFPILKSHARVVNVSSSAGMLRIIADKSLRNKFSDPKLTDEELMKLIDIYRSDVKNGKHVENGWPTTAYGMSKVALNALTFIQQRQLNSDKTREDIIVNAVHPGFVDTDMTRHKGRLTIEEGADAPTFLALLPQYCKEPVGAMVWCDRQIVDWDKDC